MWPLGFESYPNHPSISNSSRCQVRPTREENVQNFKKMGEKLVSEKLFILYLVDAKLKKKQAAPLVYRSPHLHRRVINII